MFPISPYSCCTIYLVVVYLHGEFPQHSASKMELLLLLQNGVTLAHMKTQFSEALYTGACYWWETLIPLYMVISTGLHVCSHNVVAHFLQPKLSKRPKWQLCCLLWSNFRGHIPSFCNVLFNVGGVYKRTWIPRGEDYCSPSWGWLTQQMFSSFWEGWESWSCQLFSPTFTTDIHMTLSPSQKYLLQRHIWPSEWTQVLNRKPEYDFWCLHKPLTCLSAILWYPPSHWFPILHIAYLHLHTSPTPHQNGPVLHPIFLNLPFNLELRKL